MNLPIIPYPNSIMLVPGHFLNSGSVRISGLDGTLRRELDRILLSHTGLIPGETGQRMEFLMDASLPVEGYRLEIGDGLLRLWSSSAAGTFHGLMTLRQLFAANQTLEGVSIEDAPVYGHRGFLLDVSRHFIDVSEIKRLLDLMALCKLNVFHWHLTDDAGWRIEIKAFPLLTQKGSIRSGSVTERYGMQQEYGSSGFYTQDQIREVVAYAAERHIEVVPEIDMPGHIQSALSAYPEFLCRPKAVPVAVEPGISEHVLCLGNEDGFHFITTILDEVCALFPGKRIHIGSDEVPKSGWLSCPKCRNAARTHGLETGQQLQTLFLNRVIAHLRSHGRTAIVWNEAVVDPALDPTAQCQYWNAAGTLSQVMDASHIGRSFIDSNFRHYYLDYPESSIPLRKCYSYTSMFAGGKGNLLGVEGALWTELVPNRQLLDLRLFPRLLAIAEAGWTQGQNKDFHRFRKALHGSVSAFSVYGLHLKPEQEWELKGLRGMSVTLAHYRRLVRLDTLRKVRLIHMERRLKF